jgi:hypothetical protein
VRSFDESEPEHADHAAARSSGSRVGGGSLGTAVGSPPGLSVVVAPGSGTGDGDETSVTVGRDSGAGEAPSLGVGLVESEGSTGSADVCPVGAVADTSGVGSAVGVAPGGVGLGMVGLGMGVGVVGIGVGVWETVEVGLVVGLVVGEPDAVGVGLRDGTTSKVGCGVGVAVGCGVPVGGRYPGPPFWPWVGWAVLCVVDMVGAPGQETIPYHLGYAGLALAAGLDAWSHPQSVTALGGYTLLTGAVLLTRAANGTIAWEETAEIPLMCVLMVMVF